MTTTKNYYGVSLTWDNDFFGFRQPVLWTSDYMEALDVLTKWWRAGVHFRIDSRIDGDEEYSPTNVTGHYYVSDNNRDTMADYLELLYATLYLGKADKVCFSVEIDWRKNWLKYNPDNADLLTETLHNGKTTLQNLTQAYIEWRKKGVSMGDIIDNHTNNMWWWVKENHWI